MIFKNVLVLNMLVQIVYYRRRCKNSLVIKKQPFESVMNNAKKNWIGHEL